MDKSQKKEKEVDLKVSVKGYQKEIIEMVPKIKRCNSVKMLYGFTKKLYENENTGG